MSLKSMEELRSKINAAMGDEGESTPAQNETSGASEGEASEETPKGEGEAPPKTETSEEPPKEGEEDPQTQEPKEQKKVVGGDSSFTANGGKAPAFIPSKVVKVLDKEHQIDDFVLAGIKTPEQEKKIKELYEKAHGLDHIKEKHNRVKEQYEAVQPQLRELAGLKNEIGFYNNLIKNEDYHTFFRSIKIPDEAILKVAHRILQNSELTPEDKVAYDRSIESRQRLHNLELENQQFKSQMQVQQIETVSNELDSVLTSSEYAAHVANFDARLGAGAFKREVINRAAAIEQSTQGATVLSPKDAVIGMLNFLGVTATPPTQTQQPTSQVPAQQGSQNVSSKPVVTVVKPTIPNVQAGAVSPAKKAITSIADLRKRAEAFDE